MISSKIPRHTTAPMAGLMLRRYARYVCVLLLLPMVLGVLGGILRPVAVGSNALREKFTR